ncbi:MAG: hypothetical protein ABSH32_01340 [Bryobacteraceae bacterium]|jgi:hypothetical protein
MPTSRIPPFAPAAILATFALVAAASAQQEAGTTEPKGQPPTATWLFRTDLECQWSIDGESKGVLHPDDRVRVTLALGEHLIEAVPTSGGPHWEQVINVKEPKTQVFTIPLLATKTEADGNSKAEELARARAALRTLADNIEACAEEALCKPGDTGAVGQMIGCGGPRSEKQPLDSSKIHFSRPTNVVWDFTPSKGLPPPYTGYIEFSISMYYRAPLENFLRFRHANPGLSMLSISPTSDGVAYIPTLNKINADSPKRFRYDFDLGPEGLVFRKKVRRSSPDAPWEREEIGYSCGDNAVRKAAIASDKAK